MKATRGLKHGPISNRAIVLVCDFPIGLCSRIVHGYKFFRVPPRLILITRANFPARSSTPVVSIEKMPFPISTLRGQASSRIKAAWFAALYLLYAPITYLRIRDEKRRITLVHAHSVLSQGLFGLILARLLGKPLVVTAIGTDVNWIMRQNRLFKAVSIFVMKRACTTVVISKPLRAHLLNLGVSNLRYIPSSVDTKSIPSVSKSRDDRCILFASTMDDNKRPLFLLHAFERVLDQVRSAKLFMCGNGPLRASVEQEVKKRNLADSVTVMPSLKPATLDELRSRIGIFVLPSLDEGLSLSLLEALAARQLVIATRNESNSSFLKHEDTALLFNSGSVVQLSEMLVRALTDEQLRDTVSKRGQELVKRHFSIEDTSRRLEDLYAHLTTT